MTTATDEFMARLGKLDIKLWMEGEKLRCNAPNQVMTPELKTELSARKAEIIDFLKKTETGLKTSIPTVSRNQILPLSYNQSRLRALAELQPHSSVYNIPSAFRLSGPLNEASLKESLKEIQRRHEILRTAFPLGESGPRQAICEDAEVRLEIVDLSQVPPENKDIQSRETMLKEIGKPFDLNSGPLWRTLLVRLDDQENLLLFTLHHMIFDGWSKDILFKELALFYEAKASGHEPEITKLPVQYADFANWHNRWLDGEIIQSQSAFWKKQLEGDVGELVLPADKHKPAKQTFPSRSQFFDFSEELSRNISALCRQTESSLYIALLTAFNILLHRYTEQEDQIVCTPVACRNRSELENLIGFFNNIVLLRTNLSGDPSIRELIGRVRGVALKTYENQDYPFQKLGEFPNLIRTTLTRGMFSLRKTPDHAFNLAGVSIEPVDLRKQTADFDLALYMELKGQKLSGVLDYNADLFDSETVSGLLQNLRGLLETMTSTPNVRLSELPRFSKRPEDVKCLLAEHPQVDEAVIIAKRPRQGHQNLIAYVVPNQHDMPDLNDLRDYLKERLPDYLVPYSFVPLDGLPYTDEGKVDIYALPPPATGRRQDGNYAAPQTELERQLVRIWTKVLWLNEDIGIHDNFFDLGGHSLLSVQLISEIENALNRKLPVDALLKLGTISDLVEILEKSDRPEAEEPKTADAEPETDLYIEKTLERSKLSPEIFHGLLAHTSGWKGKRVTPKSLIIGLNTNGNKQALFWCFQGFRELTQLAKYLGDDQPVYGMRSGHRIMEKTAQNINALAAYYVSEILSVQPQGPFLIGGNCQSTQIAFQIARQLMRKGHYITLLCLQEQFVAQYYPGRVAFFYGDDSTRNPLHYFNQPVENWKKFYTGKFSVNLIPGRHGQFFREPNIRIVAEKLKSEIELAQKEPALPIPPEFTASGQTVPDSAYRAEITPKPIFFASPNTTITLPVTVKNIGSVTWRGSGKDGIIALGSRWLNKNGRNILAFEKEMPLPDDLEPGSSIELRISVTTPFKKGRFLLELDMVENGVNWFSDKGSDTARLNLRILRGSTFWNWIWPIKRFLDSKIKILRHP